MMNLLFSRGKLSSSKVEMRMLFLNRLKENALLKQGPKQDALLGQGQRSKGGCSA